MNSTLVLGLMSGTSLDSVDYALCAVSDDGVRLEKHWQVEFTKPLRNQLHAAARGEATSHEVGRLHHELGRFYARHAKRQGAARPQLAGLHGQTIFHDAWGKPPATFQIGEPAYLAAALGVPVVSNFRAADLAAGGQGAPLATAFHVQAFGRRGEHVCVNNLGGISNVTSIDGRAGREPGVLAFDTGPANVLIDLAMRHYTNGRERMDRRGEWAARGRPVERVLEEWLRHRFFRHPPPKSTGRELFGEKFFHATFCDVAERLRVRRVDVVATYTAFTARSLALNYRLHLPGPPGLVILTGGGAGNPTLVKFIEQALAEWTPGLRVVTSDELGWPRETIEAAAFALLAWRRMRRQPGNLPQTTGAKRAVLLGQVTEV